MIRVAFKCVEMLIRVAVGTRRYLTSCTIFHDERRYARKCVAAGFTLLHYS